MGAERTAILMLLIVGAGCRAIPAPAVAPAEVPATGDPMEGRIRAVRESFVLFPRFSADFADVATRLQAIRAAMSDLVRDVPDEEHQRALGIEELQRTLEKERRAVLLTQVPAEVNRWLRDRGEQPVDRPTSRDLDPKIARDLFTHIARAFIPAADSAELDALIRADPLSITEVTKHRALRLAKLEIGLRDEMHDVWKEAVRVNPEDAPK